MTHFSFGDYTGDALHPGAAVGALLVLTSAALACVAVARYLHHSVETLAPYRPTRAVAVLSLLLVTALAWAALAAICCAGWEFPPARPADGAR